MMAAIEKKTSRYPTDLMDEECEGVEPLLPSPPLKGRKPSKDPVGSPLHAPLSARDHRLAPMIDRERTGRETSSSAGVIDNQSVRARRTRRGVTTPAR